jgi:antitoxin ParD1/3/4
MISLNISLPESIEYFIEQQVINGNYETANAYIVDLICQEKERVSRVEALLIEGLDSGEAIEVTEEWWEEKRQFLKQKLDINHE